MNRQGAALVIALVVLAALLFLALPFVYSQSASLAGARSAGWGNQAQRGRSAAEQHAIAVVAQVNTLHLTDQLGAAQRTYSSLADNLIYDAGQIGLGFEREPARFTFPPASPAAPNATSGVEVEDEQSRLDANALGPSAWAQLLAAAQIYDPPTWRWEWGAVPSPRTSVITDWGAFASDPLPYGRLSIALAKHRGRIPGGRYVSLDQLLGADSRRPAADQAPFGYIEYGAGHHDRDTGHPLVEMAPPVGGGITDWVAQIYGAGGLLDQQGPFRDAPPTRIELERLRAFLTVHTLGQGRSGIADLGTTLVVSAFDDASVGDVVGGDLIPAWGWVTGISTDGTVRRGRRHTDSNWIQTFGGGGLADAGGVIAVEVAPTVNINLIAGGSPVARALGWTGTGLTLFTALHTLPGLGWCDPGRGLGHGREPVPPVSVASLGVVSVDAAAAAREAGWLQASRSRRSVVQAVPQERAIERRWRTQADLESDLRLNRSSGMQSGPHPVRRVSDFASDATLTNLLRDPGWLAPASPATGALSLAPQRRRVQPMCSIPKRATIPQAKAAGARLVFNG